MATERVPQPEGQPSGPSDTAATDARAVVEELLAYVRQRMEATDITAAELNAVDMDGESFRVAMRHGMVTAFHEIEHSLIETAQRTGDQDGPLVITNSDGTIVTLDNAYFRAATEARDTRLSTPPPSDEELAEMRKRYPDAAWFWTRDVQDSIRRAEEDIATGHVTRFDSDEDFLRSFDQLDADVQLDANV